LLGSSILGLKIEDEQCRARGIIGVFRKIAGGNGARSFSEGRRLFRADAMAFPIIDGEWLKVASVHLTSGDPYSRTSQAPYNLASAEMTPRKQSLIGAGQRTRQRFDGVWNLSGQDLEGIDHAQLLPNGSRLSCGALKKDSFPNLRAPAASSAC
jgi:hypothetical protein